jgi:hypothetical protein
MMAEKALFMLMSSRRVLALKKAIGFWPGSGRSSWATARVIRRTRQRFWSSLKAYVGLEITRENI